MTTAERIYRAKQYLRRKYAGNVQGLKDLADTVVANGAFDSVTITGDSHEGTSSSGQLVFEPLEYLGAIEELIAEMDSTVPQPGDSVMFSDFSCRSVQT